MAGLNLRARHSPGLTRREATRDSTETSHESNCGVREVSCFFPLQGELHALCQCGASGETRDLGGFLVRSKARRNSGKAYALSALPLFASQIQEADGTSAYRCECRNEMDLVPRWENGSGIAIQFGSRCDFIVPYFVS